MNTQNDTAKPTNLKHKQIAARAYQIWEACGRPAGAELKHWLQAEEELVTLRPPKAHPASAAAPRTT